MLIGEQAVSSPALGSFIGAVRSKLAFRPLIYGYANARVHGMFSYFLTSAQIEELISCRTVQSLAESLERTSYKEDLVSRSLKFKGEELIELSLGQNFSKFAKQLMDLTPKRSKHILKAILSRWDAHNLKTIILARKQKKSYEQIAPFLMLAATLQKPHLKALLGAPDSESFYAQLRLTEFGQGLLKMPASPANGSIRQMILSMGKEDSAIEPLLGILDVYTYSLIADVAKDKKNPDSQIVASLLSQEALAKNLSTTLRLLNAGAPAQKIRQYIVPGGMFSPYAWANMASTLNSEQILKKISLRLPLQKAIEEYKKSGKISAVEVALSQELARRSLKTFRHEQLSLGTIVGALLFKEQEVANIRKIVRAKSLSLGEGEIRKMMVLVK